MNIIVTLPTSWMSTLVLSTMESVDLPGVLGWPGSLLPVSRDMEVSLF